VRPFVVFDATTCSEEFLPALGNQKLNSILMLHRISILPLSDMHPLSTFPFSPSYSFSSGHTYSGILCLL